jgi:fatty acid hydroxylase family protein
MESGEELSAIAFARGIRKKRNNAITALASGGVPAAILALLFPVHFTACVVGFFVGALWANLFEYVYHRFVLHVPINYLMERHLQHHATLDTPHEAEHLNFGESPLYVIGLFVVNAAPVAFVDWRFHFGCAPGVLIAFSLYFIATEEIHWRIHLGGWLPPGLERARKFHMSHHRRPQSRFAVFMPLFDWLLGTTRDRAEIAQAQHFARR